MQRFPDISKRERRRCLFLDEGHSSRGSRQSSQRRLVGHVDAVPLLSVKRTKMPSQEIEVTERRCSLRSENDLNRISYGSSEIRPYINKRPIKPISFEAEDVILTKKVYPSQMPVDCPECGKRFANKGNLKNHLRIHADKKEFACDECSAAFNDPSSLNRHLTVHRSDKPHKCKLCKSSFKLLTQLRRHEMAHAQARPIRYICSKCGYGHYFQSGLHRHITISHGNIRPHECPECEASFPTRARLRVHLRKHTNDRPYGCEFCPKRFHERGHAIVHMRTHTDERPFQCPSCGKGFNQRGNLRVHLNTHTGAKPYSCKLCPALFGDPRQCWRHMRAHVKKSKEKQSATQSSAKIRPMKTQNPVAGVPKTS